MEAIEKALEKLGYADCNHTSKAKQILEDLSREVRLRALMDAQRVVQGKIAYPFEASILDLIADTEL